MKSGWGSGAELGLDEVGTSRWALRKAPAPLGGPGFGPPALGAKLPLR